MRKDMHKVLTEDPRRGGEKFGKHRNCKGNDVFDDEVFRVHDKNHHLYLEDGVWYVYTLAVTPPARLVYERPMAVGYENWRAMTGDERAKIGHPTWVNDYAYVKPKGRDMSPHGMHYSSRQTAGRKILRQHGLVGSSVT